MRYTCRVQVTAPLPLEIVVDVVNEWGSTPRRAAEEQDTAFPSISAVMSAHGWATPRAWRPALGDAELVRAADLLFPAFAADRPAGVTRTVNALVTRLGLQPRLAFRDAAFRSGYVAERPQDALLAAAVHSLTVYLTGRDEPRLGTCTGRMCADVYADLSPARQRRFCSVKCQNRSRVAAFRARQAGGGPTAAERPRPGHPSRSTAVRRAPR